MYLRVSAFKTDPAKLDEAIAYLKSRIIPTLSKSPGYAGATCLVDREKGEGSASTLWESLEAMNNSETAGQQSRTEFSEATAVEIVDVDRFEMTDLEMVSPNIQLPSYVRLIIGYGDPKKADRTTQLIRETAPKLKAQPGFRAFTAGVNRMTGRGFTTSSWATSEQREASNQATQQGRQQITEAGGLYGVQISNLELVVAEVKLPIKA